MSLLKSAALIAVLSLVSKVFGLFREATFAYYCGLSIVSDAYMISKLLPVFALLMLGGLNGPFHSTIVSSLSRLKEEGKHKEYRIILNTFIIFTILVMGSISIAGVLFAEDIAKLWNTYPPETIAMAVTQMKIMFPMFLCSGLIGICYGVLSINQSFLTPALSPIMASLAIVIALIFFSDPYPLVVSPDWALSKALAWGTMIGAIMQLLLQLIPLLKKVKLLPIYFQPLHPEVKVMILFFIPTVLSSTVGQVMIFVIQLFSGSLATGSITAFNFANLVIQLPLGVMMTALLVPLLPSLTVAVTKKDNYKTLIEQLNQGLRAIIILTIPVTVLFIFLGDYFIALLFQRNAFNLNATIITYEVLIYLSLSIVVYAVRDLLVRVFYATQSSMIPFLTSFVSIFGMIIFCWILTAPMQVAGIALATSLATGLNFIVLSYLLYLKIGPWFEEQTLKTFKNACLVAIPLEIICYGLRYSLATFSIPVIKYLVLILSSGLLTLLYLLLLYKQGNSEVERLKSIADRYVNRLLRR